MDGIDGIAGAQAAVAGSAWAAYGIWSGDVSAYTLGGIIAFGALGFLLHNWSPASVFMGDVGSAFLGYTLAALPLLEQMNEPGKGPLLFAAAVSFVWLFIFDTAFTLVRRSLKKEKVWVAHRKHLYQRLVIAGWGHAAVSLLYAGVALLVCSAFFLALLVPGSLGRFALFIYALGPMLVLFLVLREKD
jgi:UDP-N-acetylmuramyl pentapeptide phosphotransferase/UDP-N-acetylglucosamine-1-phosphate transferase